MLNFHGVINSLSFGHVSLCILREMFARGLDVSVFLSQEPPDLSSFSVAPDFTAWLGKSYSGARALYNRYEPSLRLWHIRGAEMGVAAEQNLLTFHEVDELTRSETNILANQLAVLVSSHFSEHLFKSALENVHYCPLGYDEIAFPLPIKDRPRRNPAINFLLAGKFEHRKHTARVIKAWCDRFGNKRDYMLTTLVTNPFLGRSPQEVAHNNEMQLRKAINGPKPFNLNILPYLSTLAEVNSVYDDVDIVIDMSGGEAWSMPSFHVLGKGKHGVVLDATAMADWGPDSGAVMVKPSGKIPVYDGVFFREGDAFNQGNIFTWEVEAFWAACDKALENFAANPVNERGLTLRAKYPWSRTVDKIMEIIN